MRGLLVAGALALAVSGGVVLDRIAADDPTKSRSNAMEFPDSVSANCIGAHWETLVFGSHYLANVSDDVAVIREVELVDAHELDLVDVFVDTEGYGFVGAGGPATDPRFEGKPTVRWDGWDDIPAVGFEVAPGDRVTLLVQTANRDTVAWADALRVTYQVNGRTESVTGQQSMLAGRCNKTMSRWEEGDLYPGSGFGW